MHDGSVCPSVARGSCARVHAASSTLAALSDCRGDWVHRPCALHARVSQGVRRRSIAGASACARDRCSTSTALASGILRAASPGLVAGGARTSALQEPVCSSFSASRTLRRAVACPSLASGPVRCRFSNLVALPPCQPRTPRPLSANSPRVGGRDCLQSSNWTWSRRRQTDCVQLEICLGTRDKNLCCVR
jgi:hypothetical protein